MTHNALLNNRRLNPTLFDDDYLHLITLREKVAAFALHCSGTLVDYGCGSKPYRGLFSRISSYRGVDFHAVDPDDMLLTPDGSLPCADASADVIVSFQVLEHVPVPEQYAAECMRVLRPGGKLFLSTHGTWPYHPGPHNDDYVRWTAPGIRRLILDTGFVETNVSPACGGIICLLQQLLVLNDPSRVKRGNLSRVLKCIVNFFVNTFGVILLRMYPQLSQAGDIVPICFVITANKA